MASVRRVLHHLSAMRTDLRRLEQLIALVAAAMVLTPIAAAAMVDESKPFICAINTVMECDSSGQCVRHTAEKHPDFPAFLRVDVAKRTVSDGSAGTAPRTSEIAAVRRLDGRLILYGGENGRGWTATVAENTGHMSAGVVGDEYTFALFGACMMP